MSSPAALQRYWGGIGNASIPTSAWMDEISNRCPSCTQMAGRQTMLRHPQANSFPQHTRRTELGSSRQPRGRAGRIDGPLCLLLIVLSSSAQRPPHIGDYLIDVPSSSIDYRRLSDIPCTPRRFLSRPLTMTLRLGPIPCSDPELDNRFLLEPASHQPSGRPRL